MRGLLGPGRASGFDAAGRQSGGSLFERVVRFARALHWFVRLPSRRMSRATRGQSLRARILGIAILLAISALYLFALREHPLIVGMFTIICTATLIRKKRQWRRDLAALAQEREGESICDFARAFDTRTTDTWVIRAVYEQLQQQLGRVYPDFRSVPQTV